MTTHRWVKNSQGEYVAKAFPGVVPAAKPEAEVAPEWRYIPTVKYTELTEGMTLINQAGEKWVIKAIDKTGVPARWKYKLVNPTTGYEWSRPFIEVERYLKSAAAIPKPEVTPEVTEYIPPEGTIAQVIPVKSRTDPTKWALLSKAEGTTFGVPRSYAEVKLAADKENVRMAAYEKAVGIKREAKVTTPKSEAKAEVELPRALPSGRDLDSYIKQLKGETTFARFLYEAKDVGYIPLKYEHRDIVMYYKGKLVRVTPPSLHSHIRQVHEVNPEQVIWKQGKAIAAIAEKFGAKITS